MTGRGQKVRSGMGVPGGLVDVRKTGTPGCREAHGHTNAD